MPGLAATKADCCTDECKATSCCCCCCYKLLLLLLPRLSPPLPSTQGIKLLYVTLAVSLPAFLSIGCIILLVFFVFGYLGVQVRGERVLW